MLPELRALRSVGSIAYCGSTSRSLGAERDSGLFDSPRSQVRGVSGANYAAHTTDVLAYCLQLSASEAFRCAALTHG